VLLNIFFIKLKHEQKILYIDMDMVLCNFDKHILKLDQLKLWIQILKNEVKKIVNAIIKILDYLKI
jgi:hypothetical protein